MMPLPCHASNIFPTKRTKNGGEIECHLMEFKRKGSLARSRETEHDFKKCAEPSFAEFWEHFSIFQVKGKESFVFENCPEQKDETKAQQCWMTSKKKVLNKRKRVKWKEQCKNWGGKQDGRGVERYQSESQQPNLDKLRRAEIVSILRGPCENVRDGLFADTMGENRHFSPN